MIGDVLVLIGAGGHAKVVYDAVSLVYPEMTIVVRDDDTRKAGVDFLGTPIRVPALEPGPNGQSVHIAIGDNVARAKMGEAIRNADVVLQTVRHPATHCSLYAEVAKGCFLAAHTVVGPATKIETGVIINHGAVVDHDCRIGAWSHIAPNSTLGGNVEIGQGVLIGARAVVLPGLRIGDHAIIGAGAVVTHDVPAGTVWAGVPARLVSR